MYNYQYGTYVRKLIFFRYIRDEIPKIYNISTI